jgi:hypothetical protein
MRYGADRKSIVEKTCTNPSCCEHGLVQELPAFAERGRLFLYDDDDVLCHECGEEMRDLFISTT